MYSIHRPPTSLEEEEMDLEIIENLPVKVRVTLSSLG